MDSTRGMAASLRINRTGEIIGGGEQFVFDVASSRTDFTALNQDFLERISRYLQSNTGLVLKITGRYSDLEKNVPAGMYENLGLARAANVRDTLVQRYRVRSGQIWIVAEMTANTDPDAATAPEEPLRFQILQNKNETVPAHYEFTNMTFSEANFKNRQTLFTPTLPFVIYSDSLKKHAETYPGRYIWIVTYAASRAERDRATAQARAESVHKYLSRTRGIRSVIYTNVKMQPKDAKTKRSMNIQVGESF